MICPEQQDHQHRQGCDNNCQSLLRFFRHVATATVKWNWPFVYDFSATPFNAPEARASSPKKASEKMPALASR
jgi:hypothetical protein